METLSAEHRAVLEMYKKERPDIFARLPLPRKLAEEYGVPIKEDTVHLMDFMKSHMSIVNGHYDAVEEKVACKVTDASGVEIVGKMQNERDGIKVRNEQNTNNMRARSEFYRTQPQESIEERSEQWIKELQSENLENQIEMNLLSSQSKPTLNIVEGGTNAAFVPN